MKRHRFSLYDTLFLTFLIVGCLLVLVRFRALNDSPLTEGHATAEIVYTLRADSSSRAETIAAAKSLYLADSGVLIGSHKKPPSVKPAYTEALRPDGTLAFLESAVSYEIRGTLLASGTFTDNGFFLKGGHHITANQSISVDINGLKATILVLKINSFSSN